MRTRVKICGITNAVDANWAARCGADALGFVFYRKSPRAVNPDSVQQITHNLSAFVNKVGLFVNPEPEEVKQALSKCQLDTLQFHGDESLEFCEQFNMPYLKAIRVRESDDIRRAMDKYRSASGILLDSYQKGIPGGTGTVFDWNWVVQVKSASGFPVPLILAGGLTPENVVTAIETVKPYAVDVSGGVEERKGKKDSTKVAKFIQGVNSVEHKN